MSSSFPNVYSNLANPPHTHNGRAIDRCPVTQVQAGEGWGCVSHSGRAQMYSATAALKLPHHNGPKGFAHHGFLRAWILSQSRAISINFVVVSASPITNLHAAAVVQVWVCMKLKGKVCFASKANKSHTGVVIQK